MKNRSKDQRPVHPRINAGYCLDKGDEKVLEDTFEA